MMQRFGKRPRKAQAWQRLVAMSTLGLVGATLLGVAGCDTVALISFSERRFQEIQTSGVTGPVGMCDGSDGDLRMRFVLMATDQTPIQPGQSVALEEVNLTRGNLTLSDGRIFSLPDERCDSADFCEADNFVCTAGSDSLSDNYKRCNKTSALSLEGQPRFVASPEKPQYFGVLFEHSGSLRGFLPDNVSGLYAVDDSGELLPGAGRDRTPNAQRATDPQSNRQGALSGIVNNWKLGAAHTPNRNTFFGLWSFNESRSDVIAHVGNADAGEPPWTRSSVQTDRAKEKLEALSLSARRASVFASIHKVLTEDFSDPSMADASKTLVVFVDGPDDLRPGDNAQANADSVTGLAADLGVRLFIVHLDPAVDASLLRDDFEYYENQQPCDPDDANACLNFEECRKPERFSNSAGGGSVDYPADLEANYCLPKRDNNGRLGPIHDYARMACETEGGYLYVASPKALRRRMEWLPFVMDGLWEVDMMAEQVAQGSVPGGEPYKLQSTFEVNLGGDSRTYSFSQLGDPAPDDDAAGDTRSVFFTAP